VYSLIIGRINVYYRDACEYWDIQV
jgi:hypothetical protein